METKKQILSTLEELADKLILKEDAERSNYDAIYSNAPVSVLQTDVHNRMRRSIFCLNSSNYEIQCAIAQLKSSINQNDI